MCTAGQLAGVPWELCRSPQVSPASGGHVLLRGGPLATGLWDWPLEGSGHGCLANWQSACFSLQVWDRVTFSPKPFST